MTIPKLTPYTGQVANPDGSQTQTEFTQNMFDQLSYEANLATELDATVDGINQAVTDVENSAAAASASATSAEASASTAGYQGLWPDTGGSANKGDTYQTQVGGTPTGQYFTALQDTTVDPVGDDVNWREVVSNQSLGGLTSYQAASVADMIAGVAIGGVVITPELGQTWSSGGIKWRREGIGESISDFSVLSAIVDNEEIGGTTSTAGLGVIGCAVRISPNPSGDNTFDIIDDSEHDPINCVSVSADSNSVNVAHESPLNSDVVGSAIVAPDETLVKRGIMVGGSIATTQSIVTMTKRHNIKLDWAAAASEASDLVVDSFVGSSRYIVGNNIGSTGAFRINHPETLDGVRSVSPLGLDAPDVVVAEVSGNTVDLFPYKTVRITAKRVGGSWLLTGSNSTETAIIALGFTVTDSSNIITINHPTVLSGDAQPQIQWVGVNTYRSPNVLLRGATSCTFTPIDESGNPSPASDGDEFYVTLHEVLWLYGESSLDLGIIELNPLTDFKDIANSNNFWLLGNHWVDK